MNLIHLLIDIVLLKSFKAVKISPSPSYKFKLFSEIKGRYQLSFMPKGTFIRENGSEQFVSLKTENGEPRCSRALSSLLSPPSSFSS